MLAYPGRHATGTIELLRLSLEAGLLQHLLCPFHRDSGIHADLTSLPDDVLQLDGVIPNQHGAVRSDSTVHAHHT